eukprot:GHVS01045305.1.p1 GENE.GHVS01045305.1~~GHVS01045305.1.p1  ORF type:complete len:170 (+),score=7.37 GHVS01045305.1:136-645(+)
MFSSSSGDSIELVVHNVLMSSQVSCPLDLDYCCCHFGNAVYNPDDFRCLRVDVKASSGDVVSISVFSNGKMQATGGRTVASTRRSLKKVAKRLKGPPLNYPVAFKKPEVSNMLAVFDLGYSINLVHLSRGTVAESLRAPHHRFFTYPKAVEAPIMSRSVFLVRFTVSFY